MGWSLKLTSYLSVGLFVLNDDGTVVTDSQGLPKEIYTNADSKNTLTRALVCFPLLSNTYHRVSSPS